MHNFVIEQSWVILAYGLLAGSSLEQYQISSM